ncbi:hypothetical protein JCM18897A_21330 [Streptomyces sp. JCM 18897]
MDIPRVSLVRSRRTLRQGACARGFRMAREGLQRLTGNGNGTCGKDDCPNVYRTASGSIIVQGDVSTAFRPPDGEGIVEIPEETLREAFRALGW